LVDGVVMMAMGKKNGKRPALEGRNSNGRINEYTPGF
jgi:hypothetical protein